jgi:hypothetical protein
LHLHNIYLHLHARGRVNRTSQVPSTQPPKYNTYTYSYVVYIIHIDRGH